MSEIDVPDAVVDWVTRLHAVVDELVRPIAEANAERLHCRAGCTGCCSDGLSVFEIEAAVIARSHGDLLAHGEPHAEGACAFLDSEGSCRIYEARPYVCRTQGLPLRWLEDDEEGPIEARDICPLNIDGTALEELPADACWTIGPIEQRLATQQKNGERIALRDLFARARKHHLPVVK